MTDRCGNPTGDTASVATGVVAGALRRRTGPLWDGSLFPSGGSIPVGPGFRCCS